MNKIHSNHLSKVNDLFSYNFRIDRDSVSMNEDVVILHEKHDTILGLKIKTDYCSNIRCHQNKMNETHASYALAMMVEIAL